MKYNWAVIVNKWLKLVYNVRFGLLKETLPHLIHHKDFHFKGNEQIVLQSLITFIDLFFFFPNLEIILQLFCNSEILIHL